jgi:hypothetical protein
MKYKLTTALLFILNVTLILQIFFSKKDEQKIQTGNIPYQNNRMSEKADEGKYVDPTTSLISLLFFIKTTKKYD